MISNASFSSWTNNTLPPIRVSHVTKDEWGLSRPTVTSNCSISSNESTSSVAPMSETKDQGKGEQNRPMRDSGFLSEDLNRTVRKPYTITKSKESRTEQEDGMFLEALQLQPFCSKWTPTCFHQYACVVSSLNQMFKAASHVTGPFQSSAALHEPGHARRPDSFSVPRDMISNASLSSCTNNSLSPISVSHVTKDDWGLSWPTATSNCSISSNESTPSVATTGETKDQGKGEQNKPMRGM
ncbi:unnamed protein product [Ilex paraguariensis]|uniref:Uncharacterized protein n=1 Tax=Ilex paraguariensis TaxID=185542 RepID=A0ABC8SHQ5_9AQUA